MYGRVLDSILSLGYRYAYLLGNHDPQGDLSQREIIELDMSMGQTCSLTQLGPENVTGASNYLLSIQSAESDSVACNLWVLDSNGAEGGCEGVDGRKVHTQFHVLCDSQL